MRWPGPDGKLDGASFDANGQPFPDEAAALTFGYEQMGQIQRGEWIDPAKGDLTLNNWVNRWWQSIDVDDSTRATYKYEIETLILPFFGEWTISQLGEAGPEIAAWERRLVTEYGYGKSTAAKARSRLGTILGDAITTLRLALPNAARRPRGRGKRTGRQQLYARPEWATPLQAVLAAERAAIMSGHDDDFVLMVTKAWTGMRWGEVIGLEREQVRLSRIFVEWQLHELNGRFTRKPPKSDSYRNGEPGQCGPVDLPPFLADLLSEQAKHMAGVRCTCTGKPPLCDGRAYMFLRPNRTHWRRSPWSTLVWRPAAHGWYPEVKRTHWARPRMPVLVDAGQVWPGAPLQPWPPAEAGVPYEPPRAGQRTGRKHIPEDTPLASWLPIKPGLTPRGLRVGHRTWLIEAGVPEVLLHDRLGHEMGGIGGVYSRVSPDMRKQLVEALQQRWEQALTARYALSPHSPVPVLEGLLAPMREHPPQICSHRAPKRDVGALRARP